MWCLCRCKFSNKKLGCPEKSQCHPNCSAFPCVFETWSGAQAVLLHRYYNTVHAYRCNNNKKAATKLLSTASCSEVSVTSNVFKGAHLVLALMQQMLEQH